MPLRMTALRAITAAGLAVGLAAMGQAGGLGPFDPNLMQLTPLIQQRNTPLVRQTLMGALRYLQDSQIRSRPGKSSSIVDYCGDDGCDPRMLLNTKQATIEVPLSWFGFNQTQNHLGEWASTVHFLPARLGNAKGQTVLAVQDSNLFTTAAVVYPLYLVVDDQLPTSQQFVSHMIQQGVRSFAAYQEGNGFNFWPRIPGTTSAVAVRGPYNIPVALTEWMGHTFASSDAGYRFWSWATSGLDVPSRSWISALLNPQTNPYGYDAAFNVPNDADDTAVAVAIQLVHGYRYPNAPNTLKPNTQLLWTLTQFRDEANRTQDDPRTNWKGPVGSGAFLTWLKDERLDTFGSPQSGVIPLGVNNVDCVVNANALFALGLIQAQDWPGFAQASALMQQAATTKAWQNKCGLYYPQRMIFPYSLSRAYRDGGVQNAATQTAVEMVLHQLLNEQHPSGSFEGGADPTRQVSTALAAIALLNIGRDKALDLQREADFDQALEKAIAYLLQTRQPYELSNSPNEVGYVWDAGLFFSASFWDFAQWRSQAYTAAMVIEALTKYLLAYDRGGVSILQGRRLHLVPGTANAPWNLEVR